jgi:hypothetical protein
MVELAGTHCRGEGVPFVGVEHEDRTAAVLGVADGDPAVDEGDLDASVLPTSAALAPLGSREIHPMSSCLGPRDGSQSRTTRAAVVGVDTDCCLPRITDPAGVP